MSENSDSEGRPPAQEVVLDLGSEARLISRIKAAIKEPSSETSKTPELSESELEALTDVIDAHVDARVAERMSGEEKPATEVTQEERQKRIKETR